MLLRAKRLSGYRLACIDGTIGSASEFYFDDRYWTIRYLVANTAGWLSGRKVLLSPYSVSAIDPADRTVSLSLTKTRIEGSPSIDEHEPVSREFEGSYYRYYGFPSYWGGPCTWGRYPYLERNQEKWSGWDQTSAAWDRHLRSSHQVAGYCIVASDGEIGHVEDFIIDEDTWTIRYLIVATTNFWPGKKILISPQWVASVNWEAQEVVVDLSRETIKKSPAYLDEATITREYETGLYGCYDREGYWVADLATAS